MNIEGHDVVFSFDRPDSVRPLLLEILQQAAKQAKGSSSGRTLFLTAQHVLIIDAHEKRALYLERVLGAAGYVSVVTTTALEAFTLFLQGTYIPFAIILGHNNANNRFFLQRLLQQVAQKYDSNISLIRLHTPAAEGPYASVPLLPAPKTASQEQGRQVTQSSGQLPSVSQQSPVVPSSMGPLPRVTRPLAAMPPASLTGPQAVGGQGYEQRGRKKGGKGVDRGKISLVGQDIDRYHIIALLGSVAGNVYQAYDHMRRQRVALKAVQMDAVYLSTEEMYPFRREANLVEMLRHPHILPILDCGRSYAGRTAFMYKAMPYCMAGSLAQWLASRAKVFDLPEVLPLVRQLAEVLQYMHDRKIVYQNFKLSNLLLGGEKSDIGKLYLLLSDFPIDQEGVFVSRGSYLYMAPEMWKGQAQPASDQYALAAIAYELLTGRPPFQGNIEHTMKHLHLNVPPQLPWSLNPSLPSYVNSVLLRGLAKRPDERFGSIADFAEALQGWRE